MQKAEIIMGLGKNEKTIAHLSKIEKWKQQLEPKVVWPATIVKCKQDGNLLDSIISCTENIPGTYVEIEFCC